MKTLRRVFVQAPDTNIVFEIVNGVVVGLTWPDGTRFYYRGPGEGRPDSAAADLFATTGTEGEKP